MSDIEKILTAFSSISLQEMDGVKLMDRTDKKFVFHAKQLADVLRQLPPEYRVLKINDEIFNRYETLYFDTSDFQLYLDHHQGKATRYKVRSRKYVESALNFFEIKKKNNKGRTIKNRIPLPEIEKEIGSESTSFLAEKSPLEAAALQPKLWSNCTRITLVNTASKERLTIDINLHFKSEEKEVALPNIVIAELKQEKSASSPFIQIMKKERIRRGSISKYCMAVGLLFDAVKKNNFKKKINLIHKINYAA
ncbi:MAG: polyphosphate polymerase domain-containing protein [Flavobacteriales bacterium]